MPNRRWSVKPEGTIKADEASVASAQLQLDWSRITAPVDGRVGLKQVDVGNRLQWRHHRDCGDHPNTSYRSGLYFAGKRYRHRCTGTKAGKPLVVEAWDRTNSKKLSEGTLLSLDNQIDATTEFD